MPVVSFTGSAPNPASCGSVFFSILIHYRNIVRLCERTVPVVFFTGSAPNPASGGSVFFSILIPHRNIVRLCERTVPVVFFTGSAPNPASGGSVFFPIFIFSYLTEILCVCVIALCLLSSCVCVLLAFVCFLRLCDRTVPVVFFTGSAPNPASGGSVFFSILIPHRNFVRLCDALCLLSLSQEVPQTPQVVAGCFFLFSYLTGILCVCVTHCACCLLHRKCPKPRKWWQRVFFCSHTSQEYCAFV